MRRKKTHEEYVAQVAEINPNIEVISKYINNSTKILHKCKIDGHEWLVTPGHILGGRSCPICGRRSSAEVRSKGHLKYVEQVANINNNIMVIGIYVNNYTSILHECKIDGYQWLALPSNILKGKGCPECARRNSRAMTTKEYISKLHDINSNVDVLEEFLGLQKPILHRCKIDGYEWLSNPINMLNGATCPLCSGRRKTTESFKQEVTLVNPDVEIIGEYVNTSTKIHCKCRIDGYEWYTYPLNLLKGCGCPLCAGVNKKTHNDYVRCVDKIHNNIIVIGQYINARTKILHKCTTCGTEWLMDPHHILAGRGCPACNQSHGERAVAMFLDHNGIEYIRQYPFNDCIDQKQLPFDFYLPCYNVCIEYDGIQHFEPVEIFGGYESFKIIQYHDSIKTNYCDLNNITLFRIRYDEDISIRLNEILNLLKQYKINA